MTDEDRVAIGLLFVLTILFVGAMIVGTTASLSEGPARLRCQDHPTWHYDGPGTFTKATCTPPDP